MTREEAIQRLKANRDSFYFPETIEALDMAIEALSKPNYETDTEVRLAVTDRNKDKVILWDAFGEFEYYPIEALQTDAVSREDYHNLVTASNDIDRALREYQEAEENGNLVKVVRCKDCRHKEHCHETVAHTKDHEGFKEHWSEPIEWCSRGERKGGDTE